MSAKNPHRSHGRRLRHLTIAYPGGDPNPYTLGGTLKTPTTQSETRATGTAKAAKRFHFRDRDHIRPGDVFERLRGKGCRIAAACWGKAYTKMSENWCAIRAPGERPASEARRSGWVASGGQDEVRDCGWSNDCRC